MPNTTLLIITLILALFPFLLNTSQWAFLWQLKEYRLDRLCEFLSTPEGHRAIFSVFHIYGIAAILLTAITWFLRLELTYYVAPTLLAAETTGVLYKLFIHKIKIPRFTQRLLIILLATVTLQAIILIYFLVFHFSLFPIALLFIVLTPSLMIGIALILTWPIAIYKHNQVLNQAALIRPNFAPAKFIGITGSFGKTSVKKFLDTILSAKYSVLSTPKNINSEIGVATWLLQKAGSKPDFFVIEMGAYKLGEISLLGKIARHEIGFLTGINEAHLGLFGSIENTIKAKSEIAEQPALKNGVLYINFDCDYCRIANIPKTVTKITYGISSRKDILARSQILNFRDKKINFRFIYKNIKQDFHTSLLGEHNILNLTGIIALAYDLGMSHDEIQNGLNKLMPPPGTMHPLKFGHSILINDTYNSNPDGIIAGCKSLEVFDPKMKRAIVLDDILELGATHKIIHEKVAAKLTTFDFDKIFLIGKNYAKIFLDSLEKQGFLPNNIITKPDLIVNELKKLANNNAVILFEGRQAEVYLNKLLKDKHE
ncbi:MAG: UDP-N-acetylmuramoyl-tripeptide--D-alanyl-D-alanine ligase [Patescibacteria group bacterium]|nr:UDP-N-acetylmuramoyl-tripeptide--D-alanyl-D-alanine ligase [Patescibacteria group bacterium]